CPAVSFLFGRDRTGCTTGDQQQHQAFPNGAHDNSRKEQRFIAPLTIVAGSSEGLENAGNEREDYDTDGGENQEQDAKPWQDSPLRHSSFSKRLLPKHCQIPNPRSKPETTKHPLNLGANLDGL